MRFHEAAHLLGEWMRSYGRFDLKDVAERKGVSKELEFLMTECYEMLYDDLNTVELEKFYKAQTEPKTDWFREALGRWF